MMELFGMVNILFMYEAEGNLVLISEMTLIGR